MPQHNVTIPALLSNCAAYCPFEPPGVDFANEFHMWHVHDHFDLFSEFLVTDDLQREREREKKSWKSWSTWALRFSSLFAILRWEIDEKSTKSRRIPHTDTNFHENNSENTVFVLLKPNNQRRGSEHQTSSNRPAGKLEGKLKQEKIHLFTE